MDTATERTEDELRLMEVYGLTDDEFDDLASRVKSLIKDYGTFATSGIQAHFIKTINDWFE